MDQVVSVSVVVSWILKGAASLLLLAISWIASRMIKNVDKIADRVAQLERHQPNSATKSQIDVVKDRMERNQKEMYDHQDKESDKMRRDINQMAEGLRSELTVMSSSIGQISGVVTQLNDSISKLNSTMMKHLDKAHD